MQAYLGTLTLMGPLLEVKGLHAAYGQTRVLHGIDFAMEEGSITALLGANGAGKTTTLRALCGMVKTEGEIRFAGARIDGRSDRGHRAPGHRARARRPRHLRQPDHRGEPAPGRATRGATRTRWKRTSSACYGYFPRLKERRRQQAGTLSGGEQQMLAVSRALMLRPRLMLLDEPSFGLAPLMVRELFGILRAASTRTSG